jgi:hypothetical protein
MAKTEINTDNICQCSKYISKISEVKQSLLSKESSKSDMHTSENTPNNNGQTELNFEIIRGIKVQEI